MSLREQFEKEQFLKTTSLLELMFLCSNTEYIRWLEDKINKL